MKQFACGARNAPAEHILSACAATMSEGLGKMGARMFLLMQGLAFVMIRALQAICIDDCVERCISACSFYNPCTGLARLQHEMKEMIPQPARFLAGMTLA
jgi:hypothetical protein